MASVRPAGERRAAATVLVLLEGVEDVVRRRVDADLVQLLLKALDRRVRLAQQRREHRPVLVHFGNEPLRLCKRVDDDLVVVVRC